MKFRVLPVLTLTLLTATAPAIADPAPALPAETKAEDNTKPTLAVQETFDNLSDALIANDYAAFMLLLDEEVRGRFTKPMFEGAVNQIGPRLKGGYEATFIESAKKETGRLYLWKLAFKDKKDELVANLLIRDKKVIMFLYL